MSTKYQKYERALVFEILIKREYKELDDIINSSETIFDIGGHYGFFSLYAILIKTGFYLDGGIIDVDNLADICRDALQGISTENQQLKIHFFEPVTKYFIEAKNLLSKFENHIIFNNSGILNEPSVNIMQLPKISSQSSLYQSFLNKPTEECKCSFLNLGEYIKKYGVDKINLLKMDVEGAEFDILLNADENIFGKIECLFLEYHILDNGYESKLKELLTILKKHYIDVKIIESNYDSRIGYLFCK